MKPPIQLFTPSKKLHRTHDPQNLASCIAPPHVHEHAAAAKLESNLFVTMDMPYDIWCTPDPFDHHTHRYITMTTRSPTLGMSIVMCSLRHQLQLKACHAGQPAAKIPNWRDDIKNAYITHVNDLPVATISDIKLLILKAKEKHDKSVLPCNNKQCIHNTEFHNYITTNSTSSVSTSLI